MITSTYQKPDKCVRCQTNTPSKDDEFCEECLTEIWASAPDSDDDSDGYDPYWGPA